MFSALLAMVMVFALTCTPAFAAKTDTLAAGPNNEFVDDAEVFSDPDGDGVYDQRLEKENWKGEQFISSELVSATAAGPFQESNAVSYERYFDWSWGVNRFEWGLNGSSTGYRTVTTDYLVEKFGANTLIVFWDKDDENHICLLLTGKAAPEGTIFSPESEGIYISGFGDLVSGWARKTVNAAGNAELISGVTETNHNYDFTGKITCAEFADLAMRVYYTLSGADGADIHEDPLYGRRREQPALYPDSGRL